MAKKISTSTGQVVITSPVEINNRIKAVAEQGVLSDPPLDDGSPVAAGDSLCDAISKLQVQITGMNTGGGSTVGGTGVSTSIYRYTGCFSVTAGSQTALLTFQFHSTLNAGRIPLTLAGFVSLLENAGVTRKASAVVLATVPDAYPSGTYKYTSCYAENGIICMEAWDSNTFVMMNPGTLTFTFHSIYGILI